MIYKSSSSEFTSFFEFQDVKLLLLFLFIPYFNITS